MGWPQLVFQNCSFLIGKPTEVLGAQMTRSPAGLSAVHRVVHPDLDDSAGQSMTSWKKKNNLDCGEGVKSTERERYIYICTEIKSTLAPVWIREFWPKLCPAFVRISHGAPGKKHSWEEAYCGTQCQYNLQPSWTSVHIIIMSISSNLSIYPFMYPSIYLSDAAPSSRVCPGSHVTATRVARKVFAHPPAWENTHFPGLQYHCMMDY
jgi:hypothetical protein